MQKIFHCRQETAERVTISFGLRNVTNRDMALREAFRVLNRVAVSAALNFQLFRMPHFLNYMISGHLTLCHSWAGVVARDEAAYRYLAESIRTFPAQHDLARMMSEAGFAQVRFRNLSNGIAAIHSGWKLD